MNLLISIFWAVVTGSSYQACYKEGSLAEVCAPANGVGTHAFSGLKFDTDYVFTYKQDGVESLPWSYHTPVKKTPPLTAPTLVVVAQ